MSKKNFDTPYFNLFELDPGNDPDPGHGSATSTPDYDIPWDWENWSVMFDYMDENGDGTPGTWEDYVAWWKKNNFPADLFEAWNGEPLP